MISSIFPNEWFYTYIYIYIHTHTHIHIYVCICVCVYVCMCVCVYIYISTCHSASPARLTLHHAHWPQCHLTPSLNLGQPLPPHYASSKGLYALECCWMLFYYPETDHLCHSGSCCQLFFHHLWSPFQCHCHNGTDCCLAGLVSGCCSVSQVAACCQLEQTIFLVLLEFRNVQHPDTRFWKHDTVIPCPNLK